jgi:hypothetical protein
VAFLVPDSCRATIRNGNNISTDVTEDIILFSHCGINNKRMRIPKEQSKMDNPEKLAQDEEKQNKNTTQYVLDNTI